MSTKNPNNLQHWGIELPSFQVIAALFLIAVGSVFLAIQTGLLKSNDNWWVIFLFIPALVFFWSAFSGYQHAHVLTGAQIIEALVGILLLLLTFIFIVDPQWSFFSAWGLNNIFPGVVWDNVWRVFVLGFGLVLFIGGVLKQWLRLTIFGLLTSVVGAVFVFNIDWNYVWPLAIVALGVWLLIIRRNAQ
jgi:hypothetical protein